MILSYLSLMYNYFFEDKFTNNHHYDIIPLLQLLGYYNINITKEQKYKLHNMLTQLVSYDNELKEYPNISSYMHLTLEEIMANLRKTEEFTNFTKELYKNVERSIYLSRYLTTNYSRANYFKFLTELTNNELDIIKVKKF